MKNTMQINVDPEWKDLRKMLPSWSDSKRSKLVIKVFKNSKFLDKLRVEPTDSRMDRAMKEFLRGKI